MADLFETMEKLKAIRETLRAIEPEFPGLYSDFVKSLLHAPHSDSTPTTTRVEPDALVEDVYVPVTINEDNYKPTWQIISEYLSEHPWSTLTEIADGTGVRFSIVNSTVYCGSQGRFTSRTDTRSKDKRAKVWNNAAVGETSIVGNKKVPRRSTRKTTTKLIIQWLDKHGPSSVADVSSGIQNDVKTDPTKLKASVRSILSRLANDKLVNVAKVDGGNLYSVFDKEKEEA